MMSGEMSSGRVHRCRSGQAMILSVLAIGGTLLGATTIAGLVMLYQLRQTRDTQGSAKAVFAADAGVEYAIYHYFNSSTYPCYFEKPDNTCTLRLTLPDGVTSFESVTTMASREIRSVGASGNVKRAFLFAIQ